MNKPNNPRVDANSRFSAKAGEKNRLSRLAVQVPGEAAEMLGVSADFFDEHIRPELRIVYRGRLRLVSVIELERWLERSAALTLEAAA